MPRRKKNGQSPGRVPGGPGVAEGGVGDLGRSTGHRAPQGLLEEAMADTRASQLSSSDKENIVRSMHEMFSHLDPEVLYIVLSECDFKVENAMDSLLELSVAAEDAAPVPPPVSGFERTAAALLSQQHVPEPGPEPDSPGPPSTNPLDELDLLADQELETLTTQQHVEEEGNPSSQYLSSFPPPAAPQHVLPELLQSSLQPGSKGASGAPAGHIAVSSSPPNQLSTTEEQPVVLDFSHLLAETSADKPNPALDLAATGRPSAFQVYKKQETSHTPPDKPGAVPSNSIVGGARSKVNAFPQDPPGNVMSPWNLEAPAFAPRHQGPAFITPVAHSPSSWPSQPRHVSPWLRQHPLQQAPLKPSATIPKSWALPAPQPPGQHSKLRLEGRVLVLLRGAPGSGKSTMARALVEHNPGGVRLSTDDYFIREGGRYQYDPTVLGEAHEWNHKRAKEAFERGANPIIIDNTNMQGWEMRPYVVQALRHGYRVLFREPDTWWKNKPRELQKRTTHDVPVETIRRMLNGYERFVSVQSIMGSQMPEFKQRLLLDKPNSQSQLSEAPCPDLVGRSGSSEERQTSQRQMFSSLPDVSSIGRPGDVAAPEDAGHRSTESLDFQPAADSTPDNDDLDMGELDSELENQLMLDQPMADQRIPDCIVESVMSEDQHADELPVAFSESIGQRVRRERPSRRSEPADLVKDATQSSAEAQEQERPEEEEAEEMPRGGGEGGIPEMLDFVGDWPHEGSLEQRRVRRRERRREGNGEEDEGAEENKTQSGPDVTEFQKLLDLIQTGAATCLAGSSRSSSLSLRSGEESDREEGASPGSRSNSEERQQNKRRGELPDCVLDWKAADYCKARESRMDRLEADERESSLLPAPAPDSLAIPGAAEAGVCREGAGSQSSEGELALSEPGEERREERRVEASDSDVSVVSQSPVCDERERRPRSGGRRSGKQCKLALTFTQNCPVQAPVTPDGQSTNRPDSGLETDCGSRSELPSSPLPQQQDGGSSTQTEPGDFALLWRLNRRDVSEDPAACVLPAAVSVLCGDSSRFVPGPSSGRGEVPYRVVHEKGSQVEERDFGAARDRLESMRILSRHFKLVSFDTLEDLYDKCQQDLEWTTNLLLDSGERFFRDEDGEIEEENGEEERGSSGKAEDAASGPLASEEEDTVSASKHSSASSSDGSPNRAAESVGHKDPDSASGEESSPHTGTNSPPGAAETNAEGGAWGGASDDLVIVEEEETSRLETDGEESVSAEESVSMEEVYRVLQAELDELEREKEEERRHLEERRSRHLDIRSVELKLPTEVALQLTELFGPVGVDPGTCSSDEYTVQMDLTLAKELHQKWKDTIQEKQRQAALSFHLLQESSVHWGESQAGRAEQQDRGQTARFLISADGYAALDAGQSDGPMPFMDHWSASRPQVSLRDIIKEEQARQDNVRKTRQSRADLDRRDGAALLKENELYSLFPNIDRHFLQDIFRDHNYSLTQTEVFLRSILNEEPVKTVVAPEVPLSDHHRAASREREREKRQKPQEPDAPHYQDTEDPDYEDFRAEARLQKTRQLESFAKAAEAFKQGRKQVASFYAQQGHLHGKRMREAHHRAASQIFERVNASLLPQNILDLHGLHVDEALQHLAQVLKDKSSECAQGLCRPQLSVITGRGNHSQGGVARIRPAVIDYLTNKHYRFTEPKPGLVLVSLR